MKSEAWYDKEQGILFVQFAGNVSVEDFRELNAKLTAMPSEYRLRTLVDLSELSNPLWDKETRQMLASETTHTEGSKVALIGASPFIRVLARVFTKREKDSAKFFKTEQDAIKWLKEGKS